MADDALAKSGPIESPAPAASEENDATRDIAPAPAPERHTEKSASGADDEDIEMKSADEAAGAADDHESERKDKPSASSPKKEDGHAEEGEDAIADKTQEVDEDKEENTGSAPTLLKKSQRKKSSDTKAPARRKSVTNIKDKDNNGTPARSKKAPPAQVYKPEDLVLHKLKGYPPWPAVILSDEVAELKPQLIKSRPGKSKAKGVVIDEGVRQAYPVAYLHNLLEFSYAPILDLEPLTKDHIKNFVAKGRKKDLSAAFEIAKKGVAMDEVKELFMQDPMAVDDVEDQGDEEADEKDDGEEGEEEEEAEEEEEGEEEGEPTKLSQKKGTKRKKAEDSEEEDSDKPTKTPRRISITKTTKSKTPKSTVKVAKTPSKEKTTNGSSTKAKTPATTKSKTPSSSKKATSSTKSKRGSKKPVGSEEEEEAAAEASEAESPAPVSTTKKSHKKKPSVAAVVAATPAVEEDAIEETEAVPAKEEETPEQAKDRRHKEVLYIRHRLQKGFLTRDHVPNEEEMPALATHLTSLENMDVVEVSIIKETKINKVLKMITKLGTIPSDEKYHIRERAVALLEKVNQILASAPPDEEKESLSKEEKKEEEKTTNGAVDQDEEMKDVEKAEEVEGKNKEEVSKGEPHGEVIQQDEKEESIVAKDGDGDEKMTEA